MPHEPPKHRRDYAEVPLIAFVVEVLALIFGALWVCGLMAIGLSV